ncbi:junctional sarcoplasmic reticulum protein 1 [Peromyscus maniculatus bairdii]|uniref:junctional sarcoplasmic reticulum protein 1 n=1 Tax=Peromyscus maniculatus bairdii TaxID=230844 RepID=UPI00042AC3CC|nr:junctional sarcoplasmic reticulum protein 1 [Peromyscus maniculatus bairdii]
MTTRGLEDLDGGLGSCLPSDEFPLLEEPRSGRRPDGKARGASRPADSSSWTHVLQAPGTAGAAEKELEAREAPGTSKGTPKAGTSPRSVPARRKLQAAPPLKPPPPPPPPPSSDDLPWGDLTLNKCLVLASLVALLGSALQLCQDAVAGEVAVAAPPQRVPPSPPPQKPKAPAPEPQLSGPPPGPPEPPEPPGPPAQKQDPSEAAEAQGEPGGSAPEASGEERAPLGDRGSQERPRKEKPRTGEKPKKEKPRREKPGREERRRATREPGPFLSRRREAREGGRRPWTRDSRELEHGKRPAWAPRRRRDSDSRPRQRPRGGTGRD